MFSKRKRRIQDEEPLVPHGLVWQAMSEMIPTEEEKARLEHAGPPSNPLQSVPPEIQVSDCASPDVIPAAKKSAKSAPLFWQKLPQSDMVRPPSENGAPVADADPAKRSSSATRQGEPAIMPLKATDRNLPGVAREVLGQGFGRLQQVDRAIHIFYRKFIGVVRHSGVATLTVTRAKVRTLKARQRDTRDGFKTGLAGISGLVAAQWRNSVAKLRRGYQDLKSKAQVRAGSCSRWTRARRETGTAEAPVRTPASSSRSQRHAIAIAQVLGAGALQGRVLLARLLSVGKGKLAKPRRDRQLLTSMAMAGFSALLLLGFISAVRHYATEALPSHMLHKDSSTACQPAEVAGVPPQAIARQGRSTQVARQSSLIPRQPVKNVQAVRPKPRHNEDEDYVARDTFVSYGNRRSGSR